MGPDSRAPGIPDVLKPCNLIYGKDPLEDSTLFEEVAKTSAVWCQKFLIQFKVGSRSLGF